MDELVIEAIIANLKKINETLLKIKKSDTISEIDRQLDAIKKCSENVILYSKSHHKEFMQATKRMRGKLAEIGI